MGLCRLLEIEIMTPEEQVELAHELWATAQCATNNIGVEGVVELMLPIFLR